VALPEDYWNSFEHTINNLAEYLEAVRVVSAYQVATGTRFVWRGVTDASWALHSSLVRRYGEQNGDLPTERQLHRAEVGIVEEAREWGLDWHATGGRLTGLELLAAMQHFGTPTRMLDFTFNPLIALWFAVERTDGVDGRVFAIDFSERIVDRALASSADPWWFGGEPDQWSVRSWVWRPPPIETRMIRQDGCFLFGGIPVSTPARNTRDQHGAWRLLLQREIRECMSVPLSLINYDQAVAAAQGRRLPGRPPSARSFTLRIREKAAIRNDLERTMGYTYATIYPDFPGFALYAESLRLR
jgi:FRG domain